MSEMVELGAIQAILDRITTIADEACGHCWPEESADESLTRIERKLFALRAERAEPQTGSFVWAFKQDRPMRRTAWLKSNPIDEKDRYKLERIMAGTWVWCRVLIDNEAETPWITLLSGKPIALRHLDYIANDWEVL